MSSTPLSAQVKEGFQTLQVEKSRIEREAKTELKDPDEGLRVQALLSAMECEEALSALSAGDIDWFAAQLEHAEAAGEAQEESG